MKLIPAFCSYLILLFASQSFGQTFRNGKLNGTIIVKDITDKSHFLQYEFIANEHTFTIVIYNSGAEAERFSASTAKKVLNRDSISKPDSSAKVLIGNNAKVEKGDVIKVVKEKIIPANMTPLTPGDTVSKGDKISDTLKIESAKVDEEKNDREQKDNQSAGWGAPRDEAANEKASSAAGNLKEAIFYEMSFNTFKPIFEAQVKEILASDLDTVKLDVLSTQIFYQIQSRLDFLDDEPMTSRFILKQDNIWSFLSSNTSTHYSGPMASLIIKGHIIKDLEIEIEYGALKNITLRTSSNTGDMIRNFLIFKNQVPFSSSSKFDPESIAGLRLFCQNCGGVENIVRFIKLGDLLTIDNILQNHKEDYSPYNQTFIIDSGSPIKEVRKESRSKIIDVATFTDFNGFNDNNPNGLLQIEASRRINLNTKHKLIGKKKDFSTYFDYGRILGNPVFIKMQKRLRLVFRVDFVLDKELRQLIKESKQFTPGYNRIENVKLKNQIREVRESYIYRQGLFDHFIKDVSPEYNYDEATFESSGSNIIRDNNVPVSPAEPRIDSNQISTLTNSADRLSGYYRMKLQRLKINYINWFGYFEPTFRFSKIEEQNKRLNLPDAAFSNGIYHLNSISLYQHQKLSLGGDLNIVKLSFTQAKLNFYLNGGILWYQADVEIDAIPEPVAVSAYNGNVNIFLKFNPDGRWGCSFGAEYSKSHLLTDSFIYNVNSRMLQYKFDAFLNTNNENRLFFKFRINNQVDNLRNSFSQIQFGYSMNIFQGRQAN